MPLAGPRTLPAEGLPEPVKARPVLCPEVARLANERVSQMRMAVNYFGLAAV